MLCMKAGRKACARLSTSEDSTEVKLGLADGLARRDSTIWVDLFDFRLVFICLFASTILVLIVSMQ